MEGERVIGEYVVGERIGSGSFAVVWRARHRATGAEVAVKEIDRKRLSRKVLDSLRKEITILRHISHPNIVQLLHDFQTEDKIYLVLEYCTGGDLAAYIQRYGRVSEAIARHFMRQLASGLQVLRENNLIHRDLKPQNLLLSTCDEMPILKIGDFGFARYLMPQGLADTLCGSPLYMAPEIIQNKKYDAKADLWSVGAILFQLVTGKPPFDGNSQLQLFQNVLTSNELQFPKDVLMDLHPDCIDLCKRLLCRNPVERLTFEHFFNHKFMAMPRLSGSSLKSLQITADDNMQKAPAYDPPYSSELPSMRSEILEQGFFHSTSKVADSFEAIECEYVLVHAHCASTETLPSSLDTSLQDTSLTKHPSYIMKKIGMGSGGLMTTGDLITSSCGVESVRSHMSALLSHSNMCITSEDLEMASSSHPSARLQFLYQSACAISEVAQEKLNAGLNVESFAVELVALAVWREALRVCGSLMASAINRNAIDSSSANEWQTYQKYDPSSPNLKDEVDFSKPLSVCSRVERAFILAYDRAEKISNTLQIEGDMEMPDAMEIIFQTALSVGKSGAVDELRKNWSRAVASYAKATTLLKFILVEAMSLPLNPPFSLSLSDQQRIQRYIIKLRAHMSQSQMAESPMTKP